MTRWLFSTCGCVALVAVTWTPAHAAETPTAPPSVPGAPTATVVPASGPASATLLREEAARLLHDREYDRAIALLERAAALERAETESLRLAAATSLRAARAGEAEVAYTRAVAERERRPLWKKAWFWGVLGGSIVTGLAVGLTGAILLYDRTSDTTVGRVDCTVPGPCVMRP